MAEENGYEYKTRNTPKGKTPKHIIDETLRIISECQYLDPDNDSLVNIESEIASAMQNSTFIPERGYQRPSVLHDFETKVLLCNESVLTAIAFCANKGMENPFVLNFASAKNVGGGWRKGAVAQEEAICRCSALDPCLQQFMGEFYEFHRKQKNLMYSHRMIYSPQVPVFRNDFLELTAPILCSFLTSPAVNKSNYMKRQRNKRKAEKEVSDTMRERIRRVLEIAAQNGHKDLILGAWGCGVFGNDYYEIACLFSSLLRREFSNTFETVIFAHYQNKKTSWDGFLSGLTKHVPVEVVEWQDEDLLPWSRVSAGRGKFNNKQRKIRKKNNQRDYGMR